MSNPEVIVPKVENDPAAVDTMTGNQIETPENKKTCDEQSQDVSKPEKQANTNESESLPENLTKPAAEEESANKNDVKESDNIGAGDSPLNVNPAGSNGTTEVKEAVKPSEEDNSVKSEAINDETSTVPDQNSTVAMNGNSPQIPETKIPPPSMREVNPTELVITELKQALQKTAEERDIYRKKLDNTEEKLTTLQASYDAIMTGGNDENALKQIIEQLRCKLIQTSLQLDDKMRLISNQEKQIGALSNQVSSLKEVETLTRSLLQIRNMEVKHLQAEVDDMEARINQERERYNSMINKMDAAVQLNADLKKEYETQLSLFRDLREKYEEKVTLLSEEKRALEVAQTNSQ